MDITVVGTGETAVVNVEPRLKVTAGRQRGAMVTPPKTDPKTWWLHVGKNVAVYRHVHNDELVKLREMLQAGAQLKKAQGEGTMKESAEKAGVAGTPSTIVCDACGTVLQVAAGKNAQKVLAGHRSFQCSGQKEVLEEEEEEGWDEPPSLGDDGPSLDDRVSFDGFGSLTLTLQP